MKYPTAEKKELKPKILFQLIFSRKWIFLFIFSLLASAAFVRLGFWQLERLDQRKAFNSRVLLQINQPALVWSGDSQDLVLFDMEFRKVIVEGTYDFKHEIVIRNQVFENQNGVHLVTPLHIYGSDQTILVDRGWVPYEDFINADLEKFAENGIVTVEGVLRRPKEKADFGNRQDPTPAPGESFRKAWFFVNILEISRQIPYQLVQGSYIQQSPDQTWTGYPARSTYEVEITEGPHFGYAMQWFAFAMIAVLSVPILILYSLRKPYLAVHHNNEGNVRHASFIE